MIFLSELLNVKVRDSSDRLIGRLKDAVIQPVSGGYSPILFLVVREKCKKTDILIPYEYVANLSQDEIILKTLIKNIVFGASSETYLWLNRDVMDQQIVDVGGARVVRVNDLMFGLFEEKMSILGIDVGFKGIMRRLGVASFDIFNFYKVTLIDWRQAQMVGRVLKLGTISKDLTMLHPADIANIVEDLSVKQGSRLVRSLEASHAAHVLEELGPQMKKTLINYLGPERASGIMQEMSVDETVDLLKMLPREEATRFLSYLQGSKLKKVEKLIKYPDNTAGGLMTTDFVTVRPNWTVLDAIEEVRRVSPKLRSIIHIYVVDSDGFLKGSVSLRRLLLARSEDLMKNIMKRLHRRSVLKLGQSIKEIIQIMTKYDLYMAAVIDKEHRLVGAVTIDDVMRQLAPNA